MANTRSAKKRARQAEKRRQRNVAAKSEIKTLVKVCRAAIDAGDYEQAREVARKAESRLGVAAKKGIVHQNNARRRATRLHAAIARAKGPATPAE
ncbi:MAG: 30S ribosomal protein S20 [Fimbriimonadaceae bacterium]|nr:30S ribosomal protein S20 [Fimbriimonadaceae bacterium]